MRSQAAMLVFFLTLLAGKFQNGLPVIIVRTLCNSREHSDQTYKTSIYKCNLYKVHFDISFEELDGTADRYCTPLKFQLPSTRTGWVVLEMRHKSNLDNQRAQMIPNISILLIPSISGAVSSLPKKQTFLKASAFEILNFSGFDHLSVELVPTNNAKGDQQFYLQVSLLASDNCKMDNRVFCDPSECHLTRSVKQVCGYKSIDRECVAWRKFAKRFRSIVELACFTEQMRNYDELKGKHLLLGLLYIRGTLVYPETSASDVESIEWYPVAGTDDIVIEPCSTSDCQFVSLLMPRTADWANQKPMLQLIDAFGAAKLNIVLSAPWPPVMPTSQPFNQNSASSSFNWSMIPMVFYWLVLSI